MGKRIMRRKVRKAPKVYLDNNLYTTGALNLIVGKPGIGKSVIAMAIAKELAKIETCTGLVYIDSDSKGDSTDMNNYCYDRGYTYFDVVELIQEEDQSSTLKTNLAMTVDLLVNDVENGSVVIIDALVNLMDDVTSNTEGGDIMSHFRSIIKEKNLTCIVIHHTRKQDDTFLGATAIASNVEAIHLVTDVGTKQRPDKKLKVTKDNTGQLGTAFDVKFTADEGIASTFNIQVSFTPVEVDPYEGMGKVERRQAIKLNYLLKFMIATTSAKDYKPTRSTELKDTIIKLINKESEDVTRTPVDDLYVGATFIATNFSALASSHFDVELVKENKATLKLILPITDREKKNLDLGDLPTVYGAPTTIKEEI